MYGRSAGMAPPDTLMGRRARFVCLAPGTNAVWMCSVRVHRSNSLCDSLRWNSSRRMSR